MVRVRWPRSTAEAFDVGPGGLGDPQAVEGEQGHQGVIAGTGQAGGDEQGTDFVAVQAHGVGLVVEAGAAHMDRR